jgi:hypothetical protein
MLRQLLTDIVEKEEQFYEHKGMVISQRVLNINGEPKIETTFSADAKVKETIDIL